MEREGIEMEDKLLSASLAYILSKQALIMTFQKNACIEEGKKYYDEQIKNSQELAKILFNRAKDDVLKQKEQTAFNQIMEKLKNGEKFIIAADFDSTISIGNYKYPDCGEPNHPLIQKLIQFREQGGELILWTCRMDEPLQKAVDWCKSYGLEFDAVNEHSKRMRDMYNNDTRKIYADLYIDDKSTQPNNFMKGSI